MSSIFLSHNHSDKPFARKLAQELRFHGHVVWIDEAEINIGDSLIEKIREGIDKVDYVAAVLSTASVKSEWVKKELDLASTKEIESKKVVVLPVLVEDVDLPGFLKGKMYADFRRKESFQQSLQLLLRRFGPATKAPELSVEEREMFKAQLEEARRLLRFHEKQATRRSFKANRNRSAQLLQSMKEENERRPEWSAINEGYAFEALGMPVTVGYCLWSIQKSSSRGSSPLDMALTVDHKWPELHALMEAFGDYYGLEESNADWDDQDI